MAGDRKENLEFYSNSDTIMTSGLENLNLLWASLIVDEMVRNGINYFCISPGSRSTPLTVAIARHKNAAYRIFYDERAAGFHALGYSRATGRPGVVVSTSGTAVANYFPAVVESSFDLIPFILLTADRPPELRATGANQTIQQPHIYGDYVRWQFDFPCPSEEIPPEMVLTTTDQAIYRARCNPSGPVHLNCPFREPLAPLKKKFSSTYLNSVPGWLKSDAPYTIYPENSVTLQDNDLLELAQVINQAKRGILMVGHLRTGQQRDEVLRFAKKLNWPVFADILSGLRLGQKMENLVSYYDQLFVSDKFTNYLKLEVILQLGGQVTSKRWLKFVDKYQIPEYILVTNHPFRFDPAHRLTRRIESNILPFCDALSGMLNPRIDDEWKINLLRMNSTVQTILDKFVSQDPEISEPAIARLISENINQNHSLFVASSLPVREMDMFASTNGAPILVKSNRGASGIDGTIASATGYAAGTGRPVTLLMGDLAFIHDLNSLALLRKIDQQIIIVLINNHGGGIFSFLPIAEHQDVFETFFATPHQLNFEPAAKLFDLGYHHPASAQQFLKVYKEAQISGKSVIIEVETDRKRNFELHKKLQKEIIAGLDQ
jgi:2-succinyl-5-enolpyruvyl-6-hydroxy-3-cyclohexene-1-carboxylate synthase